MRQVIQNIKNGKLEIADAPCPAVRPGHLLIQNRCSVISAGTEKMVRDLAKKSLLAKARQRPDQVRRVMEKIRSEGFLSTLRQVREKLDDPMPLGYCSAGVVIACGEDVRDFKPGDRVASNGPHAEVVCVPKNLCARVPDDVPFDRAAFAVLGAIAMQGVRLSQVTLGETAFVIGLGLVGQLTTALLKIAGVRVIATDLDSHKCDLARNLGADQAQVAIAAKDVLHFTNGRGADVVLIAASTDSDGPVTLAGEAVRQKGRVVSVGAVGMNLPRRPYYFKEAEFVVSCSYGPGRYDAQYEEHGSDYPAAYVRWTEQRNVQSVLDLMSGDRLGLDKLISHRIPIAKAAEAYELIESGRQDFLGIVLKYPTTEPAIPQRQIRLGPSDPTSDAIQVGFVGAGNFSRMILLPSMRGVKTLQPHTICSPGGTSAAHVGKKFGFAHASSDENDIFQHKDIDAVFVVTRHDQHARQVIRALRGGKHVFVEKPLCLTLAELDEIESELATAGGSRQLMVGFNRRFSPAARSVTSFFSDVNEPLTVSVRFNAGAIPAEEWVHHEKIGGGRIIGEACHAIDLATYLVGSPVARVHAESIGGPHAPEIRDDQCFVTFRHANGSISNVAYLAGGDRACPKERIEVFGGGKTAIVDDFRSAIGWSNGKRVRLWRGRQDKGHRSELEAFAAAIRQGRTSPIAWEEIRATTRGAILAVQSIKTGLPIDLGTTSLSSDHEPALRLTG